MKTGSVVVTMAMAVLVLLSCGNVQLSEAQVVDCLQVPGGAAPFSDANTLIRQLRVTPGQCCQTNSGGFCTVMLMSGNAATTQLRRCGQRPERGVVAVQRFERGAGRVQPRWHLPASFLHHLRLHLPLNYYTISISSLQFKCNTM